MERLPEHPDCPKCGWPVVIERSHVMLAMVGTGPQYFHESCCRGLTWVHDADSYSLASAGVIAAEDHPAR